MQKGRDEVETEPARQHFRVRSRTRGAYAHGAVYDVQLQLAATGRLLLALTFSDHDEANAFRRRVEDDLDLLGSDDFRRKHGLPSGVLAAADR